MSIWRWCVGAGVALAVVWAFWELGRMSEVHFWLTLTVSLSVAVLYRIYEMARLYRAIAQTERALAAGKIDPREFRALPEALSGREVRGSGARSERGKSGPMPSYGQAEKSSQGASGGFLGGHEARQRFTVLDWVALGVATLIWIQLPAACIFALSNPTLTGTEVLLSAEEWAIPFRWF